MRRNLKMVGSPNGMATVLKTVGSNPLEVRLLYPPPVKKVIKPTRI